MSDARLRVLAAMDRDDRERAEEERREWDARIVVAKALLDDRRFVVTLPEEELHFGNRLSVRTRTGWVSLADGEVFPMNTFISTLVFAVAKKCARVAEARHRAEARR